MSSKVVKCARLKSESFGFAGSNPASCIYTRLAQSVERQPFKLVVMGSSPISGEWTYSVMVITLGFGPSNLGSTPSKSWTYRIIG